MQTTKNYGKFKTIDGNRDVKPNHVNNLANAIEKKNLLKVFPVIVNERMEVIDGQHRLLAAAKLGVKVPYEVIDGLRIEDVMSINSSSKGWGVADYVKAWRKLGYSDYDDLEDFSNKYKLSLTLSAGLLAGASQMQGGSSVTRRVKDGSFSVNSMGRATKVAELVAELAPFTEFEARRERPFVIAILQLLALDEFDPERLLAKIGKHFLKIQKRGDSRYYIIQLEEIYNHHAQDKVTLYRGQ